MSGKAQASSGRAHIGHGLGRPISRYRFVVEFSHPARFVVAENGFSRDALGYYRVPELRRNASCLKASPTNDHTAMQFWLNKMLEARINLRGHNQTLSMSQFTTRYSNLVTSKLF